MRYDIFSGSSNKSATALGFSLGALWPAASSRKRQAASSNTRLTDAAIAACRGLVQQMKVRGRSAAAPVSRTGWVQVASGWGRSRASPIPLPSGIKRSPAAFRWRTRDRRSSPARSIADSPSWGTNASRI